MPRGLRLNAVAPGLVTETAMKLEPHKYSGLVTDGGATGTVEAAVCGARLIELALGNRTGIIIDAPPGASL